MQSTGNSGRRNLTLAGGSVAFTALMVWLVLEFGPLFVFDTSKASYDWQSEFRDGKQTAWGPRPKRWLIWGDPEKSAYFGNEWYFRLYRSFCMEWLVNHNLIEPERQTGGW